MGLDMMYEAAYGMGRYAFRAGSYSGFHEFRVQLEDFDDGRKFFWVLLEHSDCDGELSQEECVKLHEDFVREHDAFIEFINEKYKGNNGEPPGKEQVEEMEWMMKKYEDWMEWTGVCAEHGGRLVFA